MTNDESVEYRGKVRARDRDTSWEAASLQTSTKTGKLQVQIYNLLLEVGRLTHDEIRAALLQRGVPSSPSGIRTRVKELELAGWVAACPEKGKSDLGHPATLWRAVTEEEPAPEPAPAKPARTPSTPKHDHQAGLAQARRRALWELGDGDQAELIVRAYLDPEGDARRLREEQAA